MVSQAEREGGYAYPGVTSSGMTLRDWFAGQALTGIIASNPEIDIEQAASASYGFANQMIQRRKAT